VSVWVIANTAGSIISHTTAISIAYLASPDSSGRQSGDYYLFPPPEMSGGQGSERVNLLCVVSKSSILQILMEVVIFAENHNRYIIYISFYLNSGGICTNSGTTITYDCDGWFQLVNL